MRVPSSALLAGPVDPTPWLPAPGVVWRSAPYGWAGGALAGVVHPGLPVPVDLPEALHRAVPSRRAEFLAGRLCGLLALDAVGAPPEIGRAGRAPVWPAGVAGSISHAGGWAVAVASVAHRHLGVDIQPALAEAEAARLAPVILSASDRATAPQLGLAALVTLAFCAKEAAFKAIAAALPDLPPFTEARIESLEDATLTIALRDWRVRLRHGTRGAFCVALADRV